MSMNSGTFQDIPDNAPEVFELLADAKELRRYLGQLPAEVKPQNIEELTAFYTMCHPGPMGHLDTFLRRRSGEEAVVYATPELEPILKETYSIILYQEQFMQVVQLITGLSSEKADCFRRAMSKGKVSALPMSEEAFVEAAKKRGFAVECATEI